MTVQHVAWGKTSWNLSRREAGRLTAASPDGEDQAALLDRDPDLQPPRPPGDLSRERRSPPAAGPDAARRDRRRRQRLDRRHSAWLAAAHPPSAWSGSSRTGASASPPTRAWRRAGPVHPGAQQRHRGHGRLDRGGACSVRRSHRRRGHAAGPRSFRPRRVDSAGDSYNLAGWPTKRGHGQTWRWIGRPVEEVFAASGSARSSAPRPSPRWAGSTSSTALITRMSTSAFASAGPAIAASSPPVPDPP